VRIGDFVCVGGVANRNDIQDTPRVGGHFSTAGSAAAPQHVSMSQHYPEEFLQSGWRFGKSFLKYWGAA
jgi:hypothetical protein